MPALVVTVAQMMWQNVGIGIARGGHRGAAETDRRAACGALGQRVRPALQGSYEELFHEVGLPRFLLPLPGDGAAAQGLRRPRLERTIGVIYRPQTERTSHYFHARLPEQFDAMLRMDETRAVEPLERTTQWEPGEAPETFPFGE